MGVPACLWRRTGEIYKGNREFTELVGLDGYMMREVWRYTFSILLKSHSLQGRVCIYELMAEESAVNYWEVSRSFNLSPRTRLYTPFLAEIRKRCI